MHDRLWDSAFSIDPAKPEGEEKLCSHCTYNRTIRGERDWICGFCINYEEWKPKSPTPKCLDCEHNEVDAKLPGEKNFVICNKVKESFVIQHRTAHPDCPLLTRPKCAECEYNINGGKQVYSLYHGKSGVHCSKSYNYHVWDRQESSPPDCPLRKEKR
jgi:hypothetical protein